MSSQAQSTLPKGARVRFARQISLPEIGEAGQARLLASSVVCGASEAEAVAALYLERAGVSVGRAASGGGAQLAALPAGGDELARSLADDPRLAHASAWLRGSLIAVETIKRVLNEKDETPC
jgi:hypothetical protein